MAATKSQGIWQQTAATKCQMVHEDVTLAPKLAKCSRPHFISRSEADAPRPMGYSCYWSNTCFSPDTRLDLHAQFTPKIHANVHSEFDENLNARFPKPTGLQSLAGESTPIMKSGRGLVSATSDHCSNDPEVEWQFVVDPLTKSGLTTSTYEDNKEEEDVTFEEAVWCDTKHNGAERLHQELSVEFGTSEAISKTNCDLGPHGSRHGGVLSRQQLFASNIGATFQEISDDQVLDRSCRAPTKGFWGQEAAEKENLSMACTSSMKSLLHKVVENENLAQHVAQNDCVDNCSFCCPRGMLARQAIPTSDDFSPSMAQQDVLPNPGPKIPSSLLFGCQFTNHGSTGHLASSNGLDNLDPKIADPWDSPRLLDPQTIPCIKGISIRQGLHNLGHGLSSSSTNSQFNGADTITLDQSSVLFAEALCHSQTRAREAEKKVQRAFEEKDQLMRLFFKEAYLAFTYRQWVSSLQSENMWLRMSPQNQPVAWMQHTVFNPFSALDRLASMHWRTFGQSYHGGCNRDQNISSVWHGKAIVYLGDPNDIMMGYTLAFALGLSLAGAGLMLGWSMGWILLSY